MSRKSQKSLEKVFDQLLAAIDLCTGARLRVPALILLYSAIDIAGWLDSDEEKVELRFTKWVDTYLLPGSSLKCTALDLYGARCGLVHNYSSGSNLSRSGRATQIGYAWQPTTALRLEELVRVKSALDALVGAKEDYFIAVQVEDLIESFRRGVRTFLSELEDDTPRAEAAYAKAAGVLTELSAEKASDMLQKAKEILAADTVSKQPPVRTVPRPGRNDPCHCGSGKKFKKCCGR